MQSEPASHGEVTEIHIDIDHDGQPAIDWLANQSNLSKQQLKTAMQKGACWLSRKGNTRRLRRAKRVLKAGDTLHLYYNPELLNREPPVPTCIDDYETFSIWYKPYGLRAEGTKWGDHFSIARCVETIIQPQRPVFVVHRLDRAASGLILLAHSKAMATQLSNLFAKRQIEKRYHVLVQGEFPAIESITLDGDIDGKPATSHVKRLSYDVNTQRSLLEVSIETGRKHQIRRHLATYGYPVVGDRLYAPNEAWKEDLQLCACYICFRHLENDSVCESVLPESLDIASN